MRALIVSHRFPPDAVAGVERYTEGLARRLAADGDDVTVVCRRPGVGPVRRVREDSGDRYGVVRLAGGGVERQRPLHLAGELDEAFSGLLDEAQPDVVHVNHLIDLSPRFLTLAREADAAVVWTLHDFWVPCPRITLRRPDGELCGGPEGGRACATHCFGPASEDHPPAGSAGARWNLRALYFRRLLDVPDRLLCPSPYVAEWFRGWGLEPERIRAVPNGIELPDALAPAPVRTEPRHELALAVLGAVVPHKGHHVLVEGIAEADLDGVELLVAGPLGDRAYARELRARAASVPGLHLRLVGPYEPCDLSALLAGVDALVAPSLWPETFCLVVREALARGVPAITSRLGALPDGVEDGVDGFLYDHDAPEELSTLLRRLAREPGLLARLHEGASRSRVTTLDEHVREVRSIYDEAREARARNRERAAAAAAELAALERLMGESPAAQGTLERSKGVA